MSDASATKILHVDDNATNRYVVFRMLQNAGFAVLEAATGQDGLQLVNQQLPDLVILDVKLPDTNGFEICHHIKSNSATMDIPVLMLSASFVESQDKAQGLDSGADAYLAQPVEPIELLATIRALLRIRRIEDSNLALAKQWQTTFDSMSDGVGLLDQQGCFVQCNLALLKLLSQPIEVLAHRSHEEVISHVLGSHESPFFRMQLSGCRESTELQSQGRWYWVNVEPVWHEQGALTGAVYILTDITERKRAETALRQSEEQFRMLAQVSSVLAASIDYETTLWNIARIAVPALADFCFFDIISTQQTVQRVAWQHTDPDKQEWFSQIQQFVPPFSFEKSSIIEVLATGKAKLIPQVSDEWLQGTAINAEHLQFMRELEFCSLIIVPLMIQNRVQGALTFCLTTISRRHYTAADVTLAEEIAHRSALALDNAKLYQQAQEANRLKDQFLAVLSHELRSPLNPILGWSKLLQTRKQDETTIVRGLETIERNAKLQTQLIDDLLDVSRILQGKLVLHIMPVDLVGTIEAAIETVQLAANAKSIQIQTRFASQVGLVSGDPNRLQQVIWNLLSNAVKFTPAAGKIQVRLDKVGNQAQIQVTDTGKGISPDFLPFVFDYFRQFDSTTTRKFGGLGLGLAIVRHLLELHGGTVKADSAGEGQGATFTVCLPLMPATTQAHLEEIHATPAATLKGMKILMVEDETDTRDLIAFILKQAGAEVTPIASADEALRTLMSLEPKPDLVLSDVGMPDVDGYMFIRRIRALPPEQGGEIPAIALTAYAGEVNQQQALAAGFQRHLTKPVAPEELLKEIASLMQSD